MICYIVFRITTKKVQLLEFISKYLFHSIDMINHMMMYPKHIESWFNINRTSKRLTFK